MAEMDAETKALADETQPGKPGMGGFGHRSLHIEMKDRFRAVRTFLGQSPPTRVPHARRAIPHHICHWVGFPPSYSAAILDGQAKVVLEFSTLEA